MVDLGFSIIGGVSEHLAYLQGLLDGEAMKRSEQIETLHADDIVHVNFNPDKGATAIRWTDGTVTKVKVQPGDTYNAELGMAMCICKRAFGGNGSYNEVFKEWLPKAKVRRDR